MRFFNTIIIAIRALRRNKLRSMLTALGIIIGVAAVIVMIAVGRGAQAKVEAQIKSLGANIIMVFSASSTFTTEASAKANPINANQVKSIFMPATIH